MFWRGKGTERKAKEKEMNEICTSLFTRAEGEDEFQLY